MLRFVGVNCTRFLLAILVSGIIWGQQRNSAGLYGRVTDQQDAVILGDPNLDSPGNYIGADSFGQITATAADSRIMQFSLKIAF